HPDIADWLRARVTNTRCRDVGFEMQESVDLPILDSSDIIALSEEGQLARLKRRTGCPPDSGGQSAHLQLLRTLSGGWPRSVRFGLEIRQSLYNTPPIDSFTDRPFYPWARP